MVTTWNFISMNEQQIHALIVSFADRIHRKVPNVSLTRDDFIQEGYVAYLKAKEKFDVNHKAGASLKTYLSHRIQGAMIDATRNFFWLGCKAAKKYGKASRTGDWGNLKKLEINELVDIVESKDVMKEVTLSDLSDFLVKGLPKEQKKIFRLHALYGYSFEQIAEFLGCHYTSVARQWRLHIKPYTSLRIKSYLRDLYG